MNLPCQASRPLVLRLIHDVEQQKWFSNPFRYLFVSWDKRGEAIVKAACETVGETITKRGIEDLRIAYDVVMDMEIAAGIGHGRKPSAEDGMWEIIDIVLTLLTIGVEERHIKQLFYNQYYHYQEEHQSHPNGREKALIETVCAMADVASSEYREHDRKIEELVNAEVHDHEVAHS